MLDLWQMIALGIALVPLYVMTWAFFFKWFQSDSPIGPVLAGFMATFSPFLLPFVLASGIVVVLFVTAVALVFVWVWSWIALLIGGFPKLYRAATDLIG